MDVHLLCSKCPLTALCCGTSLGYIFCADTRFSDMPEEMFARLVEDAVLPVPEQCTGCNKDCGICEHNDKRRLFKAKQCSEYVERQMVELREKRMTVEEMRRIAEAEIDFGNLEKNAGITVFYELGAISAGVSYETGEDGQDVYIYNLFVYDHEYINISEVGSSDDRTPDVIINEMVEQWNNFAQTV